MKNNTHPTYYADAKITCVCGNETIAGSTRESLKVDICSNCHPFYTGKQKLIDTAGRVEKFQARVKAAKKHAESSQDKDESSGKKKKDGKYMTLEEIKAIKNKSSKTSKAKTKTKTAKSSATKKSEKAKKV